MWAVSWLCPTTLLSTVCILATVFLTAPAFRRLLRRRHRSYQHRQHHHHHHHNYHDADGTDEDGCSYRLVNQELRIGLLMVTAVGWSSNILPCLVSSASFAATDPTVWLTRALWTPLLLQGYATATEVHSTKAADLGHCIAGCGFILMLMQSVPVMLHLDEHNSAEPYTPLVLQITNYAAAFTVIIIALSIPRRPDVYHDGRLVDRAWTHSALCYWTWSWANDLLITTSSLHVSVLPRPSHALRMLESMQKWARLSSENTSLPRSIFRMNRSVFVAQWTAAIAGALTSIAPQWAVYHFLRIMEDDELQLSSNRAWIWIACLGLALLTQTWIEAQVAWISQARLALPVRAQLTSLIFRKCLRLVDHQSLNSSRDQTREIRPARKGDTPHQSTVNLIGVDARRVAEFCQLNSTLIQSVVRLLVTLIFLSSLLGWKSLLVGFASNAMLTPVNFLFSSRQMSIQKALMEVRENKTAAIVQVLRSIRQIKLASLECHWEEKVGHLRDGELRLVWKAYMNNLLLTACWISSPILFAAFTLSAHAILYQDLTPAVAFVSLAVFGSLESSLQGIPVAVTALLDAKLSVQRIAAYLQAPEQLARDRLCTDDIVLSQVTIREPGKAPDAYTDVVLDEVDITFPRGALSVISGGTGSGKSLLLKALLGEVDIERGSISWPSQRLPKTDWIVPGSAAFVAQTPWLETTTIRENILFGLPYDHRRYMDTLRACALLTDIYELQDSDLTQVGGAGTKLSGGQRWRVTLARALYSRAEILILDDIFSAVDPQCAHEILHHALVGKLAVGRTRILGTHHAELCATHATLLVKLESRRAHVTESRPLSTGALSETVQGVPDDVSETSTEIEEELDISLPAIASISSPMEDIAVGAVNRKVYAALFIAGEGLKIWTATGLVFIFTQFVSIGQSWWVMLWTGDTDVPASITLWQQQPVMAADRRRMSYNTKTYLGIYVVFALAVAFLSAAQQYLVLLGSIKTAKRLFAELFSTILHAPMSWVDEVPVGRILNRLTSDFYAIESDMPYATMYLATAALNLLTSLGIGAWASPIIMLVGSVCAGLCAWLTRKYLRVARSLKRLESTTRSPIYDHFSSALVGIATIRGFSKSDDFIRRMDEKIDDCTTASWYLLMFNQWIALRVGAVGAGFAIAVASIMVLKESADAALAGFVLASTLQLSAHIMATIQRYTNMELEMNAAERIVEYCDVSRESQQGDRPSAAWPTAGLVEIDQLVIKYGTMPATLRGITLSVKPRERVGIVGRTGAGKSSLAMALFRMIEAESGSIRIDGLDISRVELSTLRSRMAILQQEPILFAGTIRTNLDPFDVHDDAELNAALSKVHAHGELSKLSTVIAEGGSNLSQGQRQLICLARLLVQPAKIVVLDEATSGVDTQMDRQLQHAIRACTTSSTLLVIAHRLSTVADFDRLVVLHQGRVVEMDTPQRLWNSAGYFRAMCHDSGETVQLEAIFSRN